MNVPLLLYQASKEYPSKPRSFFITYLLEFMHFCHVKLKQAV